MRATMYIVLSTYVGHSNSGLCKQMPRSDKPMPIFSYIGFIEMAGSYQYMLEKGVVANPSDQPTSRTIISIGTEWLPTRAINQLPLCIEVGIYRGREGGRGGRGICCSNRGAGNRVEQGNVSGNNSCFKLEVGRTLIHPTPLSQIHHERSVVPQQNQPNTEQQGDGLCVSLSNSVDREFQRDMFINGLPREVLEAMDDDFDLNDFNEAIDDMFGN
eukprot:sb/3470018/